MKPSTSALMGAVIVSGGWMSLPSVAFAADTITPARVVAEKTVRNGGAAHASHTHASTCQADAHGHAVSCMCAQCVAAQAE